jgi:nickel-dependent lactate racemase
MILRLPYGRGTITADLRGLHCHELRPAAPRRAAPVRDLAAEALDNPAEGPSLRELARGVQRATVLVPDATRKVALPEILPLVFERLIHSGVEARGITVLVACGTHPRAGAESLASLLGPVPTDIRVIQHDARDEASLVSVGTVPSGLAVRLNRAALEADLLVAVSSVQHHYFAGFGGGPKLVFPGVAGYEETQANHARVIDLTTDPPSRHPRCEPGVLDGNPVAEEIALAAGLRPPDFALLLVGGGDGRPAWSAGGPLSATFPSACAQARAWFEVDGGPFRRVIAAAGGYPTDHTLIQAHKALDAACRFAAPEAEVLFVAACDGGPGSPDIEPFLADPRVSAIVARLAGGYVQYGHTALRLIEKTGAFRVLAKTELPGDLSARLGLRVVTDVHEVLESWREQSTEEPVGLMVGPIVYPRRATR